MCHQPMRADRQTNRLCRYKINPSDSNSVLKNGFGVSAVIQPGPRRAGLNLIRFKYSCASIWRTGTGRISRETRHKSQSRTRHRGKCPFKSMTASPLTKSALLRSRSRSFRYELLVFDVEFNGSGPHPIRVGTDPAWATGAARRFIGDAHPNCYGGKR